MSKYFAQKIEGKLMLCSRSIQVGDEIYDLRTLTKNKFLKDWMNGFIELEIDNTSFADKTQYFKKVGEISPDALGYVKEGDEFDEEQIAIYYYRIVDGAFVHESLRRADKTAPYDDSIKFIKTQGPCGHFH